MQRKTSLFAGCVLLAGWTVAAPRVEAEDKPAWPGPKGAVVFVEAESFTPEGEGWKPQDDSPSLFRPDDASSLKTLSGAGKGTGRAVRDIEVPAAGAYRLWVRFEEWPKAEANWRGPFNVTIEQAGKTVFDKTYGETLTAPVQANPIYPVFTWVAQDATLAPGPAHIIISKVGGETAYRREVDCLLLTPDAQYQPHYRDFGPQTYIRFRLNSLKPERVYFYAFVDHNRAPWYNNLSWDKAGGYIDQVYVPETNYLGAGEATPWFNLSRLLYPDGDTSFSVFATIKYRQPDASESDYSIDFATEPDEAHIVKTLHRAGRGAGLQLVAPPDLLNGRQPKADYDYAADTADFVKKIEPIKFGKTPTKYPVMIGLGTTVNSNGEETLRNELAAMRYMGINGLARLLDEADIKQGMRFAGSGGGNIYQFGPGFFHDPKWKEIEQAVKGNAEFLKKSGQLDRITSIKLMDEGGADTLADMAKQPKAQEAFRQWLREQGFAPGDFGAADWDGITIAIDRKTAQPRLYLMSQRFRAYSVAHFFAQATELTHKYLPASLLTTENFSDGAIYVGNMYNQGNDYFTWFKNKALDMAWSEDWTNGGATREICGWNVALLRAACKYHHQPIGMYDITSFGRSPLEVKLKAMSDIAEGCKQLEFYSYAPRYQSHELNWYHEWPMYPAVAETCHEIGAAEDVLLDAMPRPAQTAIIYSIPYDIWNEGVDNTQGFERMFTYIALKHSQVPVDILSDEDARSGYLKGYKVVYLFGDQLDARNATPLSDWVRGGGTLVLSPGAGSRDQLNQPSVALDKALGLQRAPVELLQGFYNTSAFLGKFLKSQGKVDLGGRQVDFLSTRQKLTAAPAATVTAKFTDGQAAATAQPFGKGRIVQVGFLPALTYIADAYKKMWDTPRKDELVEPLQVVSKALAASGRPHLTEGEGKTDAFHDGKITRTYYFPMPYEYDAALRQFIVAPALAAGVARPAAANAAQVEATLMEGKAGWAVPLANYTGNPVKELTLTIAPGRACGAVYSARQGLLVKTPATGKPIIVKLPLESTDFVYAQWSKPVLIKKGN